MNSNLNIVALVVSVSTAIVGFVIDENTLTAGNRDLTAVGTYDCTSINRYVKSDGEQSMHTKFKSGKFTVHPSPNIGVELEFTLNTLSTGTLFYNYEIVGNNITASYYAQEYRTDPTTNKTWIFIRDSTFVIDKKTGVFRYEKRMGPADKNGKIKTGDGFTHIFTGICHP